MRTVFADSLNFSLEPDWSSFPTPKARLDHPAYARGGKSLYRPSE